MRVFLGIFGALIGIIVGFYFLGPWAGAYYTSINEYQSPDQAGDAHDTIFIGSILACMLVGYVIGWLVGKQMTDRDAMEDL